MMIYPLFPEGRDRALTFSYDDALDADLRLAGIFSGHGLKCTFNFCADNGPHDGAFPSFDVNDVYLKHGHEIAVHGAEHAFEDMMPPEAVIVDIMENRKRLEAITHAPVKGMAYPYGTFNTALKQQLRDLGILYSRTVNSTHQFRLPDDFLEWNPTAHHRENIAELGDRFLANRYPRGTVCYIWGHSFEFDRNNNWDIIERFADQMAGKPSVWYATNMEIYDYIQAFRMLRFTADCCYVQNPSARTVWLTRGGNAFEIPSGAVVRIG